MGCGKDDHRLEAARSCRMTGQSRRIHISDQEDRWDQVHAISKLEWQTGKAPDDPLLEELFLQLQTFCPLGY